MANAFTAMPLAAVGLAPLGQPVALAISTVGISDCLRRRQGGRRAVALLGGHGVLRVVAGGERQRHRADASLPAEYFCAWWGSLGGVALPMRCRPKLCGAA